MTSYPQGRRTSGRPEVVRGAGSSAWARSEAERASGFRQRELFPLPRWDAGVLDSSGCCRAVHRRQLRKAALEDRVNECVGSLNAMYFHVDFDEGVRMSCSSFETTAAHRSMHDHVARCCRGVGPKPTDVNSAGAVRELRGARASYDSTVLAGRVAPVDLSLLSLPGEHQRPVPILDVSEGKERELLAGFEKKLLYDDVEWGRLSDECVEAGLYFDPVLVKERAMYLDLVSRLRARGLCRLSLRCKGRVGMFCVGKKSGKLRLILDCRRVNRRFRPPCGVQMGSLEAMGELELQGDQVLYGAQADIRDCFWECEAPFAMAEYFGLLPLSVAEARRAGFETIEGRSLDSLDESFTLDVVVTALPMVFVELLGRPGDARAALGPFRRHVSWRFVARWFPCAAAWSGSRARLDLLRQLQRLGSLAGESGSQLEQV